MSLRGVGCTTTEDIYWGPNTHRPTGLLGQDRWELLSHPLKVRHSVWPSKSQPPCLVGRGSVLLGIRDLVLLSCSVSSDQGLGEGCGDHGSQDGIPVPGRVLGSGC